MQRLRELEREVRAFERAPNTVLAYGQAWKQFELWCQQAGRRPLPATADTVSLHLASMLQAGYRTATMELRLSAITQKHEAGEHSSPVLADHRKLIGSARRQLREKPAGKAALTVDQLRAISRKLDDGSNLGVRDRALLVVGLASGLRRSELARLDVADVAFLRQGIRLHVGWSKNDQEAEGRYLGLFRGRRAESCPVRLLRAWLRVRGNAPGALFTRITSGDNVTAKRLEGQAINATVKRGVELIGLDPAEYGAHSLRAGLVTEAADTGASELVIMKQTGHRSVEMVRRYFRSARVFAVNPLAGAL